MLTDHEHYEELAALVVSEHASAAELEEYNKHAEKCAECRKERPDLAALAHLLADSDRKRATPENPPAGMTARFVARAQGEGVPLSTYSQSKPKFGQWPLRHAFSWAAIFVLAIGSIWVLRIKPQQVANNSISPPGAPSWVPSVSPAHPALLEEQLRLSKQLREAQAEAAQLRDLLDSQRKDKDSVEANVAALNQQIAILQNELTEARRNESEHNQEIASLEGQLKTVNSERDSYRLDSLLEKTDVVATKSKLELATQQLEEAQQLSAAANEAKDLIVARNLHIVDVHDNANSNMPRPFGRIFYAEGKKLVFFAYDLGDPQKLSAKVSFYVWGEKTGAKEVKNLGIFRADDRQDGRWVLTFDDPRVLANINTIFVTTESNNRKITKPNGNRILTAFLDDSLNHP